MAGERECDNWPAMSESFGLSDEQRQLRDLARQIARERIAPRAAEIDETESYPEEAFRLLGEQGLMGLYIPVSYGGTELGALSFALVVE